MSELSKRLSDKQKRRLALLVKKTYGKKVKVKKETEAQRVIREGRA